MVAAPQRLWWRPATGVLAAVLLLAIGLRLPALAEPIGVDQGIFATFAMALRDGLAPYRDVWDQKPPGIHLLYLAAITIGGASAHSIFWLDFTGWAATALFIGLLARRLSGNGAAGWVIGTYALLSLPYIRYGYGGFLERAVPEVFINACVAGAACLLAAADGRVWRAMAAGGAIGAAAVLKPWALALWPSVVLGAKPDANVPARLRLLAAAVPGLLAVPLALWVWLWSADALGEAWTAIVDYNRAYLARGPGMLVFADRFVHHVWWLTKTDPLWMLGVAGALNGGIRAVRSRRLDPVWVVGVAWLSLAVLAAAGSGIRLFTTYFIPCQPPLALLAGSCLLAAPPGGRQRADVTVALAMAVVVGARTLYLDLPGRVANPLMADVAALRVAEGSPAHLAYLERFGSYNAGRGYSARANWELAEYVRRTTARSDRCYIFGMAPAVYVDSDRLPANRFLFVWAALAGLVKHPGFSIDELAADLEAAKPALIIMEQHNNDSLSGGRSEERFAQPPMQHVLRNYQVDKTIEDFTVYRRLPAVH